MSISPEEYAANVAARRQRERLVPHVTDACDDDGCFCPNDVFWRRLLGDVDPCAPGRDWAAAAFGSEGGEVSECTCDEMNHPCDAHDTDMDPRWNRA